MVNTYKNHFDDIKLNCEIYGKLQSCGPSGNNHCFNAKDAWNLFCRSVKYTWLRQWKSILAQTTFLLATSFFLTKLYRDDIGSDATCMQSNNFSNFEKDLKEALVRHQESLSQQNLKFLFFFMVFILFLVLNATALTIPSEIKVCRQ